MDDNLELSSRLMSRSRVAEAVPVGAPSSSSSPPRGRIETPAADHRRSGHLCQEGRVPNRSTHERPEADRVVFAASASVVTPRMSARRRAEAWFEVVHEPDRLEAKSARPAGQRHRAHPRLVGGPARVLCAQPWGRRILTFMRGHPGCTRPTRRFPRQRRHRIRRRAPKFTTDGPRRPVRRPRML
jgi:hypothetical protein